METFFRMQHKGISLIEMQSYYSLDGSSEEERHSGLCACDSVGAMRAYAGMWADDSFEIVVYQGYRVGDLYDGVLTYPIQIITRAELDNFFGNNNYYDMETW